MTTLQTLLSGLGRPLSRVIGGAFLTVTSGGDVELIRDLASHRGITVVALLRTVTAARYASVLAAGAAGAVDWAASAAEIVEALKAALDGRCLLPLEVARSLAATGGRESRLTAAEFDWLRSLSQGVKVASLAERYHYSEREMFRRLRGLYGRLGVDGRHQAISKAAELSLME